MDIIVNGQHKTFTDTITLNELVTSILKSNQRIVAEVNGTIIDAGSWSSTQLNDNDRVELVQFVGGG